MANWFRVKSHYSLHEEGTKFYKTWEVEVYAEGGREPEKAVLITHWGKSKFGEDFNSGKYKVWDGLMPLTEGERVRKEKSERGYKSWKKTDSGTFATFEKVSDVLSKNKMNPDDIEKISALLSGTEIIEEVAEKEEPKPAVVTREPVKQHEAWGSW